MTVNVNTCEHLNTAHVAAAQIAQCERCVYFEVSDETMKKRLLKRGETSGRSDDNEETIAKRLATFHEVSEPVIDHYRQKDKLLAVRHMRHKRRSPPPSLPFRLRLKSSVPTGHRLVGYLVPIATHFLQVYTTVVAFFLLGSISHHPIGSLRIMS